MGSDGFARGIRSGQLSPFTASPLSSETLLNRVFFLVSLFVSVFVFSLGVDQRTCELASESSRLHGCSKHQGLHELVLAVSERFASAREKISVSSAVFFVFLDFTPRLPFETFFSSPISRTCFRLPFFCENCGVRSLIPVKKRSRPVGLRSVRHVPREGLARCTRTPRRFQYTFRNLEHLETVVFPFVNGRQTPSQTAMQQNACLLPSVAPNFATDTAVGNAGRDLVCDWKLRWSV